MSSTADCFLKPLQGVILHGHLREKETLTDEEVVRVLRSADEHIERLERVVNHLVEKVYGLDETVYDLKETAPCPSWFFYTILAMSWFMSFTALVGVTIRQFPIESELPQQRQESPVEESQTSSNRAVNSTFPYVSDALRCVLDPDSGVTTNYRTRNVDRYFWFLHPNPGFPKILAYEKSDLARGIYASRRQLCRWLIVLRCQAICPTELRTRFQTLFDHPFFFLPHLGRSSEVDTPFYTIWGRAFSLTKKGGAL